MAKEKTPRGYPLDPQCARKRRFAIATLMFARKYANSAFVLAFRCKMRARKYHATNKSKKFLPPATRLGLAQISNKNGKARRLAPANPSAGWDICPADGGLLQKQKPLHHSSFLIPHSSFFILHSSLFILHSSLLHSAFCILHSAFFPRRPPWTSSPNSPNK